MKAVLVHRGARDHYQVAQALAENGLLERLVTDLYWPGNRSGTMRLPSSLAGKLGSRFAAGVPSELVESCWFSGIISFLAERSHRLPFAWRRMSTRWSDTSLGQRAGAVAASTRSIPFSYSYYGYDTFRRCSTPGILFQLHPHPLSVRRILQAELEKHPETASSLMQEWELGLPERDFARLSAEPGMARQVIAASSFTRDTLVENGVARDLVHVVPYGVDHERFAAAPEADRAGTQSNPLRILFVGRLNQRKGLTYLVDAIRAFPRSAVELVIAGRPVDDLRVLDPIRDRITLRCSVSDAEIQSLYRASDLFILPSLAEGFGHVLLESLASGLPVLTTSRTAAPDLITPGVEGWIVPPARADVLAERIEWAISHRAQLALMRRASYECARKFTWSRFRAGIVEVVESFSQGRNVTPQEPALHV